MKQRFPYFVASAIGSFREINRNAPFVRKRCVMGAMMMVLMEMVTTLTEAKGGLSHRPASG